LKQADLTTRAVAAFVDLLLIMGLARLPDVLGILSAAGYILVRDGLFERRSVGKKLIGLQVTSSEDAGPLVSYRESIIRNVTFAAAFFLCQVPYAGWVLGPAALGIECLTAIGDERGMRIGDLLARTVVIQNAPASTPAQSAGEPDAGAPQEQQSS
jgi:uncharacterized RDD family membrane protein YckC